MTNVDGDALKDREKHSAGGDTAAPLEETLFDLVRMIARVLRGELTGLSPAQLMVMKAICDGANVSAHDIAAGVGISEAGISQTIKQLRRSEYVVRRRSEKDHRRFELILTSLGKQILEQNRANRSAKLREMLSALNGEEQRTLTGLLERLLERPEADNEE